MEEYSLPTASDYCPPPSLQRTSAPFSVMLFGSGVGTWSKGSALILTQRCKEPKVTLLVSGDAGIWSCVCLTLTPQFLTIMLYCTALPSSLLLGMWNWKTERPNQCRSWKCGKLPWWRLARQPLWAICRLRLWVVASMPRGKWSRRTERRRALRSAASAERLRSSRPLSGETPHQDLS